jgi:signal peptidase I
MRRPAVGEGDGTGGDARPLPTPDPSAEAPAAEAGQVAAPADPPPRAQQAGAPATDGAREPAGQPEQAKQQPVSPGRAKRPAKEKPNGPLAVLRETATLVILAVLLAVVFKTFLVQAFFIPSGSMEPTLDISDRVLVEKVSYRFGDVQRGDIVVFVHNEPGLPSSESTNPVARFVTSLGQAIGLAPPSERDFIKRVVGVPGDTLNCAGGKLYRNGHVLAEPYLAEGTTTECSRVRVPPGTLYMMGDNRNNSQDSRVFGPVDQKVVVGRAFVRIWPFGRTGWLRRDR